MKPGSREYIEIPKQPSRSSPNPLSYVLIQQNEPWVDVFTSDERRFWYQREYTGLDTSIELEAIDIQLPLAEIYRKVDFTTTEAVTE